MVLTREVRVKHIVREFLRPKLGFSMKYKVKKIEGTSARMVRTKSERPFLVLPKRKGRT